MKTAKHFLALLAVMTMTILGAGFAKAAVTDNESIDFTGFSVFVPCANNGAGELVIFQGNLHVLTSFTINKNHVSGDSHFQPQGLTGTGNVTGAKYQATGVTQEMFSGSFVNGQFTDTFVNNFRIIGQGPGNNYLVHEIAHVTINANGVVTVFFDSLSVDCK